MNETLRTQKTGEFTFTKRSSSGFSLQNLTSVNPDLSTPRLSSDLKVTEIHLRLEKIVHKV